MMCYYLNVHFQGQRFNELAPYLVGCNNSSECGGSTFLRTTGFNYELNAASKAECMLSEKFLLWMFPEPKICRIIDESRKRRE